MDHRKYSAVGFDLRSVSTDKLSALRSRAASFTSIDRAGQYEVISEDEPDDSISFTLAPQSTKYIRLCVIPYVGIGVPREENPTDALKDLHTLNANL